MKNVLFFMVIFVSMELPMQSFGQSQEKSDIEQLYKAHNDLYFTRLYLRDLKDSIVERNLRNTFKTITLMQIDKNSIAFLKYFGEYYYLKSHFALRKQNENLSLLYIDSSKIFVEKTLKIFQNSPSNNQVANLNCFIDNCSLNALSSSITILKSNILRIAMEKLYESGKDSGYNIKRMEMIEKQISDDNLVKTIFYYAQAQTYLKQNKGELAIQNFNRLENNSKLVKLEVTQHEIKAIVDSQIRIYNRYHQIKYSLPESEIECADDNTIPNKYFISEFPQKQDFQLLQKSLLKSFPNFKDTTLYLQYYVAAIEKGVPSASKKIKELAEIPFTNQTVEIPTDFFKTLSNKTLAGVNSVFVKYLAVGGYQTDKLGYFSYKDGFALITKLELISDDGKPFDEPQRFSLEKGEKKYSWKEMLKTLFMGNKGYYRFIIFVVSGDEIMMNKQRILTYHEAIETISEGLKELPKEISMKKIPTNCTAKAFIYVFEKSEVAASPTMIDLHTNGINQLKNTNLSNLLTK